MINIEFTPSHPDADAGGSGRPPDRATPITRPDRLPAQTDPADQARLAQLEEALSLPAAAPGEQRGSASRAREEETEADRVAERVKVDDQLVADILSPTPINTSRFPGGFLVNAFVSMAPVMESSEQLFAETKKVLESAGVRVRDDPEAQQARRRDAEAKREQAFQQSSVGQAVQRFVPFRFLRELLLAILQGRSPETQPSTEEQEEAACSVAMSCCHSWGRQRHEVAEDTRCDGVGARWSVAGGPGRCRVTTPSASLSPCASAV